MTRVKYNRKNTIYGIISVNNDNDDIKIDRRQNRVGFLGILRTHVYIVFDGSRIFNVSNGSFGFRVAAGPHLCVSKSILNVYLIRFRKS